MKSGKQPIIELNQNCEYSVLRAIDNLETAGYLVVKSFDLYSNDVIESTNICHLTILMVYEQNSPPVTLIFAGDETSTSVYVELNPEQPFQTNIIRCIQNESMDNKAEIEFQIPLFVSSY